METTTINDILEAAAPQFKAAKLNRSFFEGARVPPELHEPRLDQRPKTMLQTNWAKFVVDFHAQFAIGRGIAYPGAAPGFIDFYRERGAASTDLAHWRNCLLYGFSVEIPSVEADGLHATVGSPENWFLIDDERGAPHEAVYTTTLPAMTYFRGELLRKDLELFYHFAADGSWTAFRKAGRSWEPFDAGFSPLTDGLGINVFQLDPKRRPFIDRALRSNFDAYDVTRSALADEIRYNVDSLLKTKGVEWEPLLERSKDGRTVLQKFLQMGYLPVAADGDAEYLSRELNVSKYEMQLSSTRHAIFLQARLPDLDNVISGNGGTTTSITGVALGLMYQPTSQLAHDHFSMFTRGLSARAEALARAEEIVSTFGDVAMGEPRLQPNIPENPTEILQYLPNLKDILSREDLLRLMPQVDDVDGALARTPLEPTN